MPGAAQTIAALREAGLVLGIISNAQFFTPLFFEAAAGALAARGIAPAECAFVGNDMLSDIYGAANAGFQAILFAGDSRSLRLREGDRRVQGLRPFRIICSLGELVLQCFT
jgi:putative hydrolase of the HAD superfamily